MTKDFGHYYTFLSQLVLYPAMTVLQVFTITNITPYLGTPPSFALLLDTSTISKTGSLIELLMQPKSTE